MRTFASAKHFAVSCLATALILISCGGGSTNAAATSPSPEVIGTATLSETSCQVALPDRLPLGRVVIKLANDTRFNPGRFIFVEILEGHTYQELLNYGSHGEEGDPPFINVVSLVDVPSKSSGEMSTDVRHAAQYAFHCGYPDDTGKVIAFLHGPMHAGGA